jgi:hypothetical protein
VDTSKHQKSKAMMMVMPSMSSLLLLLTIVASSLPSIATSFSFSSCSATTSHSQQCRRYRLAKIHHVGSKSNHHRWRSSTSISSINSDGHYQALPPHNDPSYASTNLAKQTTTTILVAALSLATTTAAAASAAINVDGGGDDSASTTITQVISALQSSTDAKSTYTILEEISKIITEGKGIGGTLTYNSGIRLGDGVQITDEDTTIYNPGLTLLTASEKEHLVSAMIHNRHTGLSILPPTDGGIGGWSTENESAFQYIKGLLDPLHMHELSGYLSILPYWGGLLYLVAIFVQKNIRDVFPLVYGLCAAGIFVPILILIVSGP